MPWPRDTPGKRRYGQRSEHTKELPKLLIGSQVRVQNQSGNKPKRWDQTGLVVDVLPHQQYKVRIDGSGDDLARFGSQPSLTTSCLCQLSPPEPSRSLRRRLQTKRFPN